MIVFFYRLFYTHGHLRKRVNFITSLHIIFCCTCLPCLELLNHLKAVRPTLQSQEWRSLTGLLRFWRVCWPMFSYFKSVLTVSMLLWAYVFLVFPNSYSNLICCSVFIPGSRGLNRAPSVAAVLKGSILVTFGSIQTTLMLLIYPRSWFRIARGYSCTSISCPL